MRTSWSDLDRSLLAMSADLHRALRPPGRPPGLRITPAPTESEGWDLSIPLPGLRAEQVQIELDGDRLRIRAEREVSAPAGARPLLRERAPWRLDEVVRLHEQVDPSGLKATLRDGLLQVRLPRRAGGPRQIPVLAS